MCATVGLSWGFGSEALVDMWTNGCEFLTHELEASDSCIDPLVAVNHTITCSYGCMVHPTVLLCTSTCARAEGVVPCRQWSCCSGSLCCIGGAHCTTPLGPHCCGSREAVEQYLLAKRKAFVCGMELLRKVIDMLLVASTIKTTTRDTVNGSEWFSIRFAPQTTRSK